jgi:hypothetical protein
VRESGESAEAEIRRASELGRPRVIFGCDGDNESGGLEEEVAAHYDV